MVLSKGSYSHTTVHLLLSVEKCFLGTRRLWPRLVAPERAFPMWPAPATAWPLSLYSSLKSEPIMSTDVTDTGGDQACSRQREKSEGGSAGSRREGQKMITSERKNKLMGLKQELKTLSGSSFCVSL